MWHDGCIAGYICLANGYSSKFIDKLNYSFVDPESFPSKARKPAVGVKGSITPGELAAGLLGINIGETYMDHLYMADEWPEPYHSQYDDLLIEGELPAKNRKKAGRIVIRRLKYFIRTGL